MGLKLTADTQPRSRLTDTALGFGPGGSTGPGRHPLPHGAGGAAGGHPPGGGGEPGGVGGHPPGAPGRLRGGLWANISHTHVAGENTYLDGADYRSFVADPARCSRGCPGPDRVQRPHRRRGGVPDHDDTPAPLPHWHPHPDRGRRADRAAPQRERRVQPRDRLRQHPLRPHRQRRRQPGQRRLPRLPRSQPLDRRLRRGRGDQHDPGTSRRASPRSTPPRATRRPRTCAGTSSRTCPRPTPEPEPPPDIAYDAADDNETKAEKKAKRDEAEARARPRTSRWWPRRPLPATSEASSSPPGTPRTRRGARCPPCPTCSASPTGRAPPPRRTSPRSDVLSQHMIGVMEALESRSLP